MPKVGWSIGQRAAVKRWMILVNLFAVAGLILSILLIVMGNSGGWVLLALTVCMAGAAHMFVGSIRKPQPRR